MQEDFHYYATYCAAYLAGYPHELCLEICYSAQLVDLCTRTFLSRIKAPGTAATTQLQLEMMGARNDKLGCQDITRIWASFHFLPRDLFAHVKGTRRYRDKYRMICGPNGTLLADTVNLARGMGTQAAGIAMHVLADTWAHRYFAGTPSLVINNTNRFFTEIITEDGVETERKVKFKHNPGAPDDIISGNYINTIYQGSENSIMNLGHGRAGHLPDYSFIKYKYLPAWDNYREVVKDNPKEYYLAFCQMVFALRFLRGEVKEFRTEVYDTELVKPYEERIRQILSVRRIDACDDWKAFGEELSGQEIPDFNVDRYEKEYMDAPEEKKDYTYLGKFITAALNQKGMVTQRIWDSGNNLAGRSVVTLKKSRFFDISGGKDGNRTARDEA